MNAEAPMSDEKLAHTIVPALSSLTPPDLRVDELTVDGGARRVFVGSVTMHDQSSPVDPVDEASRESFPASDAPAWTPVTGPIIIAPRIRQHEVALERHRDSAPLGPLDHKGEGERVLGREPMRH